LPTVLTEPAVKPSPLVTETAEFRGDDGFREPHGCIVGEPVDTDESDRVDRADALLGGESVACGPKGRAGSMCP
jgi:hypothetical protein